MDEPKQRPSIELDRSQAEIVRQISDLYLRGKSLRAIADWLMSKEVPAPKGGRVWHASTVKRILSSPVHAGLLTIEDNLSKGAHYDQRIYDPDVFYQILEQMKARGVTSPRTLACPEAPLVQVAVCDECGGRLLVTNINNRYRAYYCGGRRLHGFKCDSRPFIRGDVLEPRFVREIEKVATDPGLLAMAAEVAKKLVKESSSGHDSERQRLLSESSEIDRQWADLGNALTNGTISSDMISACDRDLQSPKRAIAARLEQIESEVDTRSTIAVTRRALDAREAEDEVPGRDGVRPAGEPELVAWPQRRAACHQPPAACIPRAGPGRLP